MSSNSLKVVLLGDASVGKTSLIQRYISGRNDIQESTLGAVFIQLRHSFENKNDELIDFSIQFWDTAGQERYQSLLPMYLRNTDYVIIAFDLNNYLSFSNLPTWISLCKNSAEKCKYILVGCKNDLNPIIRITNDEIEEFIKYHIPETKFFSTSSITGENVKKVFDTLKEDLESLVENNKNFRCKNIFKLKKEDDKTFVNDITRGLKKWCF